MTLQSKIFDCLEISKAYLLNVLSKQDDHKVILQNILAKGAGFILSSSTKLTEITTAQWAIAQALSGPNQCVLLAAANADRKGFSVYNNSTNSCYLQTSTDPKSQFAQLATNAGPTAHFQMLGPLVWTGAIYGRRNAGVGGGWCVEFL